MNLSLYAIEARQRCRLDLLNNKALVLEDKAAWLVGVFFFEADSLMSMSSPNINKQYCICISILPQLLFDIKAVIEPG